MDGDCHVVAVCRKISPKSEKGRGRTKSLENVDRLWMPSKSLGSELADASPRIRLASYRGRLSFSFVQIIAFPLHQPVDPPTHSSPTTPHTQINQINHNVQKSRLHRPRSGQQSHGCRRQTFNRSLIPRRRSRSQQRKKKLPRERYVHPHPIAVTVSMVNPRPSTHWQPWI
jgi:hypothetical protein